MLGMRTKIIIAVSAIMLLALGEVTWMSYRTAKKELTTAVDTGNLDLVHTVAAEINTINEREFKMLESVANLTPIRDQDTDMHDKWELVNSATGGSNKYYGLGFFNEQGIGYATTGKWSDLHTRYYLSESMKGIRALQDPDFSPVNGHLCSYYAVPVRDFRGRQIGEISAVVDATDLCRTVAGINVGQGQHPFIISRLSGKYVAHEDESLVADGIVAEDVVSEGFKPIIQKIKNGLTGTEFFFDELEGRKFSVAYQPIEGSNWSAVCLAPYEDFYSGISQLLVKLLISGAMALILAFIIATLAIRLSIRPLKHVSSALKEVASGDADLTHRLESKTKDEIGNLTSDFNKFLQKIQDIINELKQSKVDLREYGERLSNMVQQNANFLVEMFNGIRDVESEVAKQHTKVDNTVVTVDKISDTVEGLRDLLTKQGESVQQASAAVTEMIGNINSVTSSIQKMANEFDMLKGNVDNGIGRQKEVNEQIKQIEEKSKMLSEANTVISSIASQTNLLAMNAAIEAAHAGEAGKGFAVVADEIRKLSENSSKQSKNIGTQLKDILTAISGVVHSSHQANDALEIVMDKANATGDLVHQIELAMAEQSEGSKQIGEALSYLNDATIQVRSASDNVDSAKTEIIEEVQELKTSSASVADYIERMEGHVKHIEASDDSLMNIATSISSSIYKIGSQIDQFKS